MLYKQWICSSFHTNELDIISSCVKFRMLIMLIRTLIAVRDNTFHEEHLPQCVLSLGGRSVLFVSSFLVYLSVAQLFSMDSSVHLGLQYSNTVTFLEHKPLKCVLTNTVILAFSKFHSQEIPFCPKLCILGWHLETLFKNNLKTNCWTYA